MTKPFRPSVWSLQLFAALLAAACAGEGPADDSSDAPMQALPLRQAQQPRPAEEQHAGSDYQRPVINPQNVTPQDEQALPGVSAGLALGETSDSCDELCTLADSVDCGGGCMQQCRAWRDGNADCIRLLRNIVDCVVVSGASCSDATEECALEYAVALERCPVTD